MARLMRFIPPAVMTGFVNALGILIFFAQVPHFWSRQPLIVGLFVLTLLIVLWAPRVIKATPAPLIAIVRTHPLYRDHRPAAADRRR
ncbi:inorganic anion transporter sulfate permease (SulP) family [Klebsiella pneumoniae]|uniref:Inorganic anion transporter sulfate permease (SulP) family n=1 Tax=Klebsiella pneumoniae TaxID=573 RepID=A0A377XUV2_KLEPN|nr:inorganic anion transporter sulfate permease (SulP) family [Klebsiella pneumoniae]